MKPAIATLLVSFTLLAGACSADPESHHDGARAGLRSAISELRSESERHLSACVAASSLVGVAEELAVHEQGMGEHLHHLVFDMNPMSACSGPTLSEAVGCMAAMRDAMAEHRAVLAAATDLAAAQRECRAHAAAVAAELGALTRAVDQLSCAD
jgi:hypothetical protein